MQEPGSEDTKYSELLPTPKVRLKVGMDIQVTILKQRKFASEQRTKITFPVFQL